MMISAGVILAYITSLLPSHEQVSHQECGQMACTYRPRDVENIQLKYSVQYCWDNCRILSFNEQELITILKSRGIPAISQRQNASRATTYDICDTTGKDYVAIRHIWSQGLGNPSENVLPHCQIRHLFELIIALGSTEVVLWVDTICVPLTEPHKRLAVLRLRDIYRKASKVSRSISALTPGRQSLAGAEASTHIVIMTLN